MEVFESVIAKRVFCRYIVGRPGESSNDWLRQTDTMEFLYSSLELLYVVVGVLLLFGAAVFVHEFGHFWVALKCGMKVEEFALFLEVLWLGRVTTG